MNEALRYHLYPLLVFIGIVLVVMPFGVALALLSPEVALV